MMNTERGGMTSKAVLEIVEDYLKIFPNETEKLAMLRERLLHEEVFNHRKSFNGHGTGAAIVLSPDKKKIYIYMLNRDELGSYEVTWVIKDKQYLRRVVDFVFLK